MPRTAIKIPQDVQDQMRRDYRRGLSLKELSAIYGIGRNKTFGIVRGCCDQPMKRGRKKGESDFLAQNAAQDYIGGLSINKIAKKYGHEIDWVYKALLKQGIKILENRRVYDIMADLQKSELTQSEIARKYNVSRQYILQIKKKVEGKNETEE